MMSLSDDKQADVIDAFNTTSRYLDDILNINNVYFDTMVSQIYPSELQLNKVNASETKAAFLDLHLSIDPFPIIGFYLYHVISADQSNNWTTSGIWRCNILLLILHAVHLHSLRLKHQTKGKWQ